MCADTETNACRLRAPVAALVQFSTSPHGNGNDSTISGAQKASGWRIEAFGVPIFLLE